jgi:signal transduction histidine kinase/DNA-binding LacI/PurR family transcriptional regulator/AraC-like DNA-binding protein
MSDASPRRIDAPRRLTIGVFSNRQLYVGSTISRYEQTLLRGVRAAAHAHGCNLLLACGVGPDATPFEELPAWPLCLPHTTFVPVGPWNADGLLAIPPFTDEQQRALQQLLPPDYPVVFTYPQAGYPSVGPANSAGVAQAFAHLYEHGHRRIAYLTTDAHAVGDAAERLAAYRAALAAHGLPFDQALVGYGGHNVHESREAVLHMLAAGLSFTAVLTSNDESAIGALRALAEAGRRVPEDVAVVGFDDVLYAKAQEPPLTTVRHPTFELGYRALELLLDYIAGRRTAPATLRVPTRLIVRESCGCLPYSAPAGAADGPAMGFDLAALLQAMEEAVAAEARQPDGPLLRACCVSLVEALLAALNEGDSAPWAAAVWQLLHDVEATGEELYPWQLALSALHAQLGPLLAARAPGAPPGRAELLLDQARVRISERLRRQNTRLLVGQAELMDRLGALTMRLLTALELRQILDILAEQLPHVGIQHAHLALFEAEEDDPVAWSLLFARTPGGPPAVRRTPSRQFPPPGLCPPDEPFHLALLPLIVEGGANGFVAFDAGFLEPCGVIARQIAAALRNSQLHAQAEEGRRLAEEASRLKSRFLSTVSHELRTPLNIIAGLSEMLLQGGAAQGPPDTLGQDLERIFFNAQHLGRLIGDVLDLASSEAGQLRLYQEPLDLAEVLGVVAATGARLAEEKGLAWAAELPPHGPWVQGDRTRLRQVALNLISNAVKFTERGAVRLTLTVAQAAATVAVSDTGPGVPPADQGRIFDEFQISERTAARAYGGLGLGLTICRQLIERHGGAIGVRSSGEPDGGATFFFTLPLLAAEPAPQGRPVEPRQPLVTFLTERATAPALDADLRARGYAVQVQHIDADANWLPRLIAAPPDALILDEPLAARRGWELLGVLKGHEATARLPVLMYALDPRTGRGALLELDYMLKPLDAGQLARAIEQRAWDGPPDARTILVVDDDPDTLALHERLVRQQLPGSRVLLARDGREALARLEQRPSLVLLDLMMPGLDGFAVLEAMRARPETADVPVVVLTSRTLGEGDLERLNAGVAAILSKDLFSGDEIRERVEAALSRQRRLSGAMQQVVRRALACFHARYAEPITRDQLALQLGVSADHLTASFRQEMGVTPMAYLNRYRISRARALLETSPRSVTEIALAVGFTDLAHFSRTFHREVGMTPNAYRRARQR